MEDGWVLGPNSELIFWVPPPLRTGFWFHRTNLFIGKFIQTRISLDSFAHGTLWTLCKTQPHPTHTRMAGQASVNPMESSPEPADGPSSVQMGASNAGLSSARTKRKASQNLDVTEVGVVIRKKARQD
jgi:hypothetical protein